jgi:hypothetical protein
MTAQSVFSPRVLVGWLAAAILTFAASLYFMGSGEGKKSGGDTIGPSSFSRSAIGYAGIAEILRRLDVAVVKSQHDAAGKLRPGGVLVLTEPKGKFDADEDAADDIPRAKALLLILPKWVGLPSLTHPGWIGKALAVDESIPRAALRLALPAGEIVRPGGRQTWSANQLGVAPTLDTTVQLMRAQSLKPIIASNDGILLGELRQKSRRVWILADPDVMDNHGVVRDGNAALSVALINALRGADGNVVFDETLHGFVARPASPVKLLFQFPFVFATVQGALAVALLLWATLGRFGAPAPVAAGLDAGKLALVENTARLLDFAGHQRMMVRRYLQAALRDVARELRAPRGLSDDALVDWLKRIGAARGVATDIGALYREVETGAEPARFTAIAAATHQWKGEILNGPEPDTRRDRRAPDGGAQGRRRSG